jgi:hypothetical protein
MVAEEAETLEIFLPAHDVLDQGCMVEEFRQAVVDELEKIKYGGCGQGGTDDGWGSSTHDESGTLGIAVNRITIDGARSI